MTDKDYATAPFNFIPLPAQVIERYAAEEDIPGHERYRRTQEGFYSGEISYEILVNPEDPSSALMIGGGAEKDYIDKRNRTVRFKDFFKNADGAYVIPGNSVRGLIRSNIQILGMCQTKYDIEDATFMYRDWVSTDKRRKEHYKKEVNLKEEGGMPGKVRAGYIYMDRKDHYVIYPARELKGKTFFRITEENLRRMIGESRQVSYMYDRQLLSFSKKALKDKNRMKSCRNPKYTPYIVQATFNTDSENNATEISLDGRQKLHYEGYLMCSGYIPLKRAHYMICPMDRESPEIIEFERNDDNIRIYQDDLARTKKDKCEFYILPKRIGEEYKKPIFYVCAEKQTYLGMTPYMRIFYPHSVWDGIPKKHDISGFDYAEAMFGFSPGKQRGEETGKQKNGFRSRISFTDAEGKDIKLGEIETILPGEPKPTCYSEYLIQDSAEEGILNSYADDFQIRGIKQYWLLNELRTYTNESTSINEKVLVRIKPIIGGTFTGKIYYENLSKDELGLLAYAVCLTENSYQNMGMAKAYGYGKIRFSNVQIKYYDFDAMYDHFELSGKEFKTLQIEELIKEYKEYVHSQKGINLDEEGSIQDFLFMKTHIMEREETEYQTLGDFSKNRVLPTVRQIRENMEEIGK